MTRNDHTRIWLAPAELENMYEEGRMWCQDNAWGDDATEYVRADLAAAERPVAVQVGELATAWKNHVAAVEAHSVEAKKLRSARWAGDFSIGFSEGVIAAERVMADAQSAFIKAAQDVAKSALASPAQHAPSQDSGDTGPSDTNGTENDG